MPLIFQQGQQSQDSQVMDEVVAFINGHDAITSTKVTNFLRRLTPAWNVENIINVMVKSGQLHVLSTDTQTGMRMFKVIRRRAEDDGRSADTA